MTDVKIVTLTGVNVWRYKFRRTLSFMQLVPVTFLPALWLELEKLDN